MRFLDRLLLPLRAAAPASPVDGELWYDAVAAKLKGRQSGSTFNLVSSGTFRTTHTFAISGSVGNLTLPKAFLDLATDQTAMIVGAYAQTTSGTVTVNVRKNGSGIAGISSIAATSSSGLVAASSPPAVTTGDRIDVVTTSATSCVDLSVSVVVEHVVA